MDRFFRSGITTGVVGGLVIAAVLLLMPVTQTQSTWLTMQSAATTGNGTVMERRNAAVFTICAEWAADVTSGVLSIEEAGGNAGSAYAGTWSVLSTIPWTAHTVQDCTHLARGAYGAIRARISTTVAGGGAPSVTVYGRGDQ